MMQRHFLAANEHVQGFGHLLPAGSLGDGAAAHPQTNLDESLLFQHAQGFPESAPAGAEHFAQFPLSRKLFSRLNAAVQNRGLDLVHHVLENATLPGLTKQRRHMPPRG